MVRKVKRCGRPLKAEAPGKTRSIRVSPEQERIILKRYGTLQRFFDGAMAMALGVSVVDYTPLIS